MNTNRMKERGNALLIIVGLGAILLLAVFLVVDGRQVMTAQERAQYLSGEAARIGANQIAPGTLTGEAPDVDTSRAYQAAQQYLAAEGATGSLTITGNRVTVTTTIRAKTIFIPSPSVSGQATASPEKRIG
ncbi:pilus assembly protein TadG-related protein [Arthrobacter woluwensis]|uniref:pilus assembly protein TadG-related protein n=1 Tax=Arthrobacter woluwensis TaxID=156980 RepID=UPI00380B116B